MPYNPPRFNSVHFRIDEHSYVAPDPDVVAFQFFPEGNGIGEISGTVLIQGTPTEDCVVKLFDSKQRFVQETISDVLGDYTFQYLDIDEQYDVIAQDPVKFWEKKIRSLVSPVAM